MADISTLPTYEMNSFALWVAKMAEKYFEDPDVKRRYEVWEKENERNEKDVNDSDCYNWDNAYYGGNAKATAIRVERICSPFRGHDIEHSG